MPPHPAAAETVRCGCGLQVPELQLGRFPFIATLMTADGYAWNSNGFCSAHPPHFPPSCLDCDLILQLPNCSPLSKLPWSFALELWVTRHCSKFPNDNFTTSAGRSSALAHTLTLKLAPRILPTLPPCRTSAPPSSRQPSPTPRPVVSSRPSARRTPSPFSWRAS